MSVATEHFYSQTQAGQVGVVRIEKGRSAWIRAGLGAVALGLYLVFAATAESMWPVLLGPFFLVGTASLMGLRPLWRADAKENSAPEAGRFGILGRVLKRGYFSGDEHQTAAMALESRIRAGEPQDVIDELTAGIENAGKKCAENAYVIGRQYMRLGQYATARGWLRTAGQKSTHFSILDELVETHLGVCNAQLLAEGDAFFASRDYQSARERYARLSHGIGDREGQGLAIFLRSACVYCMLRDYEPARQAVLQTLKSDQEIDDALDLHDLLHSLLQAESEGVRDAMEQIEVRLVNQVADVMGNLRAPESELAIAI